MQQGKDEKNKRLSSKSLHPNAKLEHVRYGDFA